MKATFHLYSEQEEIPLTIKKNDSGYRPITVEAWTPRWCECGRSEIKFEPVDTLVWITLCDWPTITDFKMMLRKRIVPFKFEIHQHTSLREGDSFNLMPHIEVAVTEESSCQNDFKVGVSRFDLRRAIR